MEWEAIARNAIIDLLDHHHALLPLEIEARLSDQPSLAPGTQEKLEGINPHHLTAAKIRLLTEGHIQVVSEATRGGRQVPVIVPTNRHLRDTIIERTAARKRLLQVSFLKWSKADGKIPNLIGEGGERVAHASLIAAAGEAALRGIAYLPVNPGGGEVGHLFNKEVPVGPLDNASRLVLLDSNDVATAIMVLIEVKNIREWIYPRTAELYQLLTKAAQLQIDNADKHFLPVLVCRRCQYTTFRMAKDLGFFVIETIAQAVLPHSEAPQNTVNDINAELGYNLSRSSDANPHITSTLARSLPKGAMGIVARWRATAPILKDHYNPLRGTKLSPSERYRRMVDLTTDALAIGGSVGGWGAKDTKNGEDSEDAVENEEKWREQVGEDDYGDLAELIDVPPQDWTE